VPGVYGPLVYFFKNVRGHFKVPVYIQNTVYFLLDIGNLGITISAYPVNLFDSRGNSVETFDKFFPGVYLVSVAPARAA
jgi:hypothetical protein